MVLIIKQEIVAHCKVCHGEKLLEQHCHFGFLSEQREEKLQFLAGVTLSSLGWSSRVLPPSSAGECDAADSWGQNKFPVGSCSL